MRKPFSRLRAVPARAIFAAICAAAWVVPTGPAAAATLLGDEYPLYIDADAGEYVLKDGVILAPFADRNGAGGYSPSMFGGPSFRGKSWATAADRAAGWTGSWTTSLSNIGYVDEGFEIGFDMNQAGKSPTLGLNRVQVEIDGVVVWDLDAAAYGVMSTLIFSSDVGCGADGRAACTPTWKDNSAGVDAALRIGFDLIASVLGEGVATGASSLTFRWTQTDVEASGELWELLGKGQGSRLDAGQAIYSADYVAAPLPAAAALLPAGLVALGLVARRRRQD